MDRNSEIVLHGTKMVWYLQKPITNKMGDFVFYLNKKNFKLKKKTNEHFIAWSNS